MRVVLRRAVRLFTDEAKAILEATAPFDWREVQGINVHGVWIMTRACGLRAMGEARACVLQSRSLMHQGYLLCYLPLETEVGGFSYQPVMVVGTLSMAWTCCMIPMGIPVEK